MSQGMNGNRRGGIDFSFLPGCKKATEAQLNPSRRERRGERGPFEAFEDENSAPHGRNEIKARRNATRRKARVRDSSRVSTICIRATVCVHSSGKQTGKYLRRARPQIRICSFAPLTPRAREQTIPRANKRPVLLFLFGPRLPQTATQ